MSMSVTTEDEVLKLLEEHPAGFNLAELTTRINKRFPIGIMGRLFRKGKVIIVHYSDREKRYLIWSYRYRLSSGEWIRRQCKPSES